jgi:signal transduction histidine kinase/CheY-like chemotaxis protein/purine-cytosine permease-like protein
MMSEAPAPPPRAASARFRADPAPAGSDQPPARVIPVLPPQRVIQVRRDYNRWVANETTEDYALRFTPRSFRKWSEWRVANTAFGAASFLILEAVGATLLVQFGFANAFWAIVATGLIIFAAGWPISVYAARYGLDMDLLTRGAGFGYLGSTITSLIYASFTFIFFALEAAVMAYALELAFDIPPAWGYLICALVVIPLVTHGVTVIGKLQVWTQPLWLGMLVLPFFYVFSAHPDAIDGLRRYAGEDGQGGAFDPLLFGAALTVGVALITQMGEQADYLRFMPERTAANRGRWWFGVAMGGPGWVVLGVAKMLAGALLAWLAIQHAVPVDRAVDPNQMYLGAWNLVFPDYGWAVAATVLFVVVSQLKINVTNAYAGSLAWSNFFARLTHSHPGRVVWMVFNTLIALLLMELNVFQAIGNVLGLYANVAIAWLMAVVADLVVNKPLGLSPKGIEFKRAHLYDINPVGVGAMGLATVLSVSAHLGAFGPMAQAFSAVIAMVTAFVAAPLIAWATGGRYYLARTSSLPDEPVTSDVADVADGRPGAEGRYLGAVRTHTCVICARPYEGEDMAGCPAYQGPICSLCCSLDARCGDLCKPHARVANQWTRLMQRLLPRSWQPSIDSGLAHYLLLMAGVVPLLMGLFGLLYHQEARELGERLTPLWSSSVETTTAMVLETLRLSYLKAFAALLLVAGVVCWWLVLAHKSRQVAQEESNRQTEALHRQTLALQAEIESHQRTDLQLQQAKAAAEEAQRQAEAANRAKSRYISTISHELRTPLNSILGYAQLLEEDESMPAHRRQAVSVIRRGGDHLLGLIEGTLDIARIEGGRLTLETRPTELHRVIDEIAHLFELQAAGQGIAFHHEIDGALPRVVRADEKRLRQILINLLGNAVKFTRQGSVNFRASYSLGMARFEIADTGPGMSAAELERVFEPFDRGDPAGSGRTVAGGAGLGLTIARMLTTLMGGDLGVRSTPGAGTTFEVRLFLPEAADADAAPPAEAVGDVPGTSPRHPGRRRIEGPAPGVLVVDNEEADRQLLTDLLQPAGFAIDTASSGEAALARLAESGTHGVDAIFMDLAMPGIDGWETIRRLRASGLTSVPIAIVSANAFDRALDNDVGITAQDFFVKPVRVGDLLDWLADRLGLVVAESVTSARRPADPVPAAASGVAIRPAIVESDPPIDDLRRLHEAAVLGYPKGVLRLLEDLERRDPSLARFVQRIREPVRRFDLEAAERLIQFEWDRCASRQAPSLGADPAPRIMPVLPMPQPEAPSDATLNRMPSSP